MRKKTSKHVTLRNVRNLVAKLKEARRGSTTVESRLEAGLHVPHLGNTTNNRLEAAWGHVKDVLKPTITPDACVDTLQFLQSIAEMNMQRR
ncbi:hypothetical protein PC118_g21412 [Phytophthora cactorum]|uniref:Uncharacterized protein n=1 Tax=Phytophthora cactorum TaxID=29920 RepID=A0A8T1F6U4_9STRA|nr:hypothetical protein PC118_g21412 [Phytophthora cactorum]